MSELCKVHGCTGAALGGVPMCQKHWGELPNQVKTLLLFAEASPDFTDVAYECYGDNLWIVTLQVTGPPGGHGSRQKEFFPLDERGPYEERR